MDSYSYYSKMVTDVIADDAPMYEKASIDEFYLDLTGMDKYFGVYSWSKELRQKVITETGLPISFGLSVNKLVAKVGTGEGKPNGALLIPNGEEKSFLAPLSTRKIPGVGKEMYKKLSFMGVRSVKILSEIPIQLLEREFGKTGRSLWQKANAIDHSPVVPYSEQKSMSKERTFMEDSLDLKMIRNKLVKLSDQLAYELRNDAKLASVVTVKIRYSDFNTYTKQQKISYTNNDKPLKVIVLQLFDKLYAKRQLIRLIGVKFSGLVHGNYQINLFDDTEKEINLLLEMDKIRRRYGANAIGRASYLSNRKKG